MTRTSCSTSVLSAWPAVSPFEDDRKLPDISNKDTHLNGQMLNAWPQTSPCKSIQNRSAIVFRHSTTSNMLCLVFQQFALARLLWEREQQAEAVAMPPNLALTSQERMEQLLWSGFVHLLYRLPALKLALTLHCQFCSHVSRCGDDLSRHLHQHHEPLVAESSTYQQLLTLGVIHGLWLRLQPHQGIWHHPITCAQRCYRQRCWEFRHTGNCFCHGRIGPMNCSRTLGIF